MYNKKGNQIEKEKVLEEHVIQCFHSNNEAYGRPRIKIALADEGVVISESKIARIMKENGLIAKAGRRRKRKKYKKSEEEILKENLLLNKDMRNLKRNEVWSSDITEFKIKSGKIYLAGVIDVASRRLVGFYIASNMRQEIVHQAIKMAISNVRDATGAIFHTDRGSQYTSKMTQKLIVEYKMLGSMSRPGKPNDNQIIESLWNSLKTELGSMTSCSKNDAIDKIYNQLCNYNNKRIHSGIDYRTPVEAYNNLADYKDSSIL